MAEKSAISWTKSTFNPWIGCTKVGPGCDHCYAEQLDIDRLSKTLGGATKNQPIIHWGHGAERYRTSVENWNGPRKWNRAAPGATFAGRRGFWPVFCASLADVFDNEVADQWRTALWSLILETPHLTWQLVTKRVGNVMKMIPYPWAANGLPENVWIIATMVNQEEFDRDWPKLREIPAVVRGLSVEPMLGVITYPEDVRGSLHWVIYGGESEQGGQARQCQLEWYSDGIAQCREFGIAPFIKQMGSNCLWGGRRVSFAGKGGDPEEWHESLRVQEFPA